MGLGFRVQGFMVWEGDFGKPKLVSYDYHMMVYSVPIWGVGVTKFPFLD